MSIQEYLSTIFTLKIELYNYHCIEVNNLVQKEYLDCKRTLSKSLFDQQWKNLEHSRPPMESFMNDVTKIFDIFWHPPFLLAWRQYNAFWTKTFLISFVFNFKRMCWQPIEYPSRCCQCNASLEMKLVVARSER